VPDEQPATAMAGQSMATATNRRVEIITRHVTARARGRRTAPGSHCFWRPGLEWFVVVTRVTGLRAPFI